MSYAHQLAMFWVQINQPAATGRERLTAIDIRLSLYLRDISAFEADERMLLPIAA